MRIENDLLVTGEIFSSSFFNRLQPNLQRITGLNTAENLLTASIIPDITAKAVCMFLNTDKKLGQNRNFILELPALSLFLPHEIIKKETEKSARKEEMKTK